MGKNLKHQQAWTYLTQDSYVTLEQGHLHFSGFIYPKQPVNIQTSGTTGNLARNQDE